MSASFHALNHLGLVLDDEAIRSRWHAQAAQHLGELQRQGLKWIADVWPQATAVPQAFITVSNRADAFSTHVNRSLTEGDVRTAAGLLDDFAGDFGKAAAAVAAYRATLEQVFGGAIIPVGALTLGPASILAVIADDTRKIFELTEQIDAARRRIEDRARAIADEVALHASILAVL